MTPPGADWLECGSSEPNASSPFVFDALTYACCIHVAPERVKTYTAPERAAALFVWSPPMPVAFDDSPFAPTASV